MQISGRICMKSARDPIVVGGGDVDDGCWRDFGVDALEEVVEDALGEGANT